MSTSLQASTGAAHPAVIGEEGRRSLAGELRQCLLSIASRSKDPRVQGLRKMIYRGDNKAADTTATILTDAFNDPQRDPHLLAATLTGFFSARTRTLRRKLSDIMQLETIEEGQLNNIEMRVAQGDTSRPALLELRKEVCENRDILNEMLAAIDMDLHRPEVRA